MEQKARADGISPALAADPTLDGELMLEIERYLATVAVFRALGHEPEWDAEERL
jgi:hypothetical protein